MRKVMVGVAVAAFGLAACSASDNRKAEKTTTTEAVEKTTTSKAAKTTTTAEQTSSTATGSTAATTSTEATTSTRKAATTTTGKPIGNAAAGKKVFAATCSACHGADATGVENLGKTLVASEFVDSQSDKKLVAFITKGRDSSDPANTTGVAMPPKGGNPVLKTKDLENVVSYIRSLKG